jgi:hypothetical protein
MKTASASGSRPIELDALLKRSVEALLDRVQARITSPGLMFRRLATVDRLRTRLEELRPSRRRRRTGGLPRSLTEQSARLEVPWGRRKVLFADPQAERGTYAATANLRRARIARAGSFQRPRLSRSQPFIFISSVERHRRPSGSCRPARWRSKSSRLVKSAPQAAHLVERVQRILLRSHRLM